MHYFIKYDWSSQPIVFMTWVWWDHQIWEASQNKMRVGNQDQALPVHSHMTTYKLLYFCGWPMSIHQMKGLAWCTTFALLLNIVILGSSSTHRNWKKVEMKGFSRRVLWDGSRSTLACSGWRKIVLNQILLYQRRSEMRWKGLWASLTQQLLLKCERWGWNCFSLPRD